MSPIILAVVVAMNGISLDCSQWSRNADGSWQAHNAYASKGRSYMRTVDDVQITRGLFLQGHVDILDAVESVCGGKP